MNAKKTIDASILAAEAASSEHKEAYKILDREKNFRIGVGARIASPNHPSFFIEILIYLSHDNGEADVQTLGKQLELLKMLQARNFKTVFQDDNCVSCEIQISRENLMAEYESTKSLIQSTIG